jgi:hypothetical protein
MQEASAQNVAVSEDSLTVDLVDGRTIIVPLMWYPRLWTLIQSPNRPLF